MKVLMNYEMKIIRLFSLFLLVMIIIIEQPKGICSTNVFENYFPIIIGSRWEYDIVGSTSEMKKIIQNSINLNDTIYYPWINMMGDKITYIDTVCFREDKVYLYKNGQAQIWFDFTKEDGETYNFPDSSHSLPINYVVTVTKDVTITTPAGEFNHCIEFFFLPPGWFDADKTYTFAPDVGMVRIQYDGWGEGVLSNYIITDVNDTKSNQIKSFRLNQNYPNPFNTNTQIIFSLFKKDHISLIVYDILGNKVRILKDSYMEPGEYVTTLNASDLSSGVYFYRLKSSVHTETRKCLFIK